MDAVYTYVDGANPSWRAQYAATAKIPLSDIRFSDHGEIVFSAQLLLKHATEWLRNVYVVHAGSGLKEETLDALEQAFAASTHRLIIVPQDDLLPGPSFSSCTVEAHLHLLPGLSENFVYLNDDMGLGRAIHRTSFIAEDGKPFVDFSAVTRGHVVCNMSQQHNENAWKLFCARFQPNIPKVYVSHFPAIMSQTGCRRTWEYFASALKSMPVVRSLETINFQLLAGLVSLHEGLVHMRARAHLPPHRLARAFVEMEVEGLQYIREQRPHFFCINGVSEETCGAYRAFCRGFLASLKNPAPNITRWSWAPLPRADGDDRGIVGKN